MLLGLLAGLALSQKLWLSSRLYPLTPVFPFIRPYNPPADRVVFYAVIFLLALLCIAPKRHFLIAALALLFLLAMQDQSRWQPWFYQYVLMLLVLAFAGDSREEALLNTCCMIVAATYFWSGLAKFNPHFINELFPALLEPLAGKRLAHDPIVHSLGVTAAFIESATGAALLFPRVRVTALSCAIAMHLFIFISLGPLGHNFNGVVWPWNAAMIAFLFILFFRRTKPFGFREVVWGRNFLFQRIVFLLFGVMPALSFFGLWDQYLSSALYSGNRNSGVIYMTDAVYDRLPGELQNYVTDEGPNRNGLDINSWSYFELSVPSYPEIRIYRSVARKFCSYASDGAGIELRIEDKLTVISNNRQRVYRCADLQR